MIADVKNGAAQHDISRVHEVEGLLLRIVEALVEDVGLIDLRWEELDGTTFFRLKVSRRDIGKVIGRQGHTVRSIRTVLSGVAMKHGRRFVLDISSEASGLRTK